jgi:hypothetical protein
MDTYAIIRDAILNKRFIRATYHGLERLMCPHTLGTKKGKPQALFYQFAGQSNTGIGPDGDPSNWRCMFLDELTNVNSSDAHDAWHTAPNHSRPQTCVDTIDVEVAL